MINPKTRELLKKIYKCPGLFLGKKTFNGLADLLSAYEMGLGEYEGGYKDSFFEFQEFVEKHYEIQPPQWGHHWSKYISFFSHTEENAFDVFYKLLEEFSGEKFS